MFLKESGSLMIRNRYVYDLQIRWPGNLKLREKILELYKPRRSK